MLRPGNFDITRSAAEAAGFKKGDKILDVGCGRGGGYAHFSPMNTVLTVSAWI